MLGKACKVIPVMLMGKVVSGNVYQLYEWLTAGMLSVGISLFLFDGNAEKSAASSSGAFLDGSYASLIGSASGFILMIGYMTFDSFTSNWQVCLTSSLFRIKPSILFITLAIFFAWI